MKLITITAALIVAMASPALAQTMAPRHSPPAQGRDYDRDRARPDATPRNARDFVKMAGASDLYEIQSSKLALQKSRSREVRSFAQMMINHHTNTTKQVKAAARAAGLRPAPPVLMPEQSRMLAELRSRPRGGFDAAYLEQQRMAHEMALALHSNYASRGDSAPLRRAASGAVPVVQRHLDQLRRMRAN